MEIRQDLDFESILEALQYFKQNLKHQPTLDEIANKVHLSPFHLERLFTDWAGVEP
jgi:AraC family transcriptional regulator, regulatory protein of adaptative response / methylated-DNA-[protein]-cysteine methyltransferase